MSELYRFPLKQCIGKPSVAVIQTGAKVKRGEMIAAKPQDGLGANIFSSIAGTVVSVNETEIVVDPDEKQSAGYVKLKKKKPLELIEEAGLVGLGGAGFPTYAKFSKPLGEKGTVIINAAECEPILSHNIARIEKRPEQLLRGLEIAMEVAGATNGVVAIKEYHKEAIDALRKILGNYKGMRIVPLIDMYPMGEERAIIREVFGEVLPVTALPLEANAIVINAETACRIAEAVDEKKPLIDKDMTVGGKIAGNAQDKLVQVFMDVAIGTPVQTMFDRAGGVNPDCGELIMGGPFTGKRTTMEDVVVKTTGGLIAAECFPKGPEKIGLLVCACGANKERMHQLAESLGSKVVGVECCKQAKEVNGNLKCENPGRCPGQVQKVMALKKAGAQAVLIGNCTDCSNTVMSCAPKMGLPVYHCTDGALRAVNHKIVRAIKK
ncbi:proline reductase-associated electron transfer protein PrdC [Lachnospiraceae bacterium XBB1006]|nr:proline reductase-associated electron transfer protein PrdC [Lachnospiraceae bacterium XBB1006]